MAEGREASERAGASDAAARQPTRSLTSLPVLQNAFRPFFLGGAVWAAAALALWLAMLSGRVVLPTAFDPLAWHQHEMLFGYAAAIIAGFALTAVPNWTGRLPIRGAPLAGLFILWLAGRVMVQVSLWTGPLVVIAVRCRLPRRPVGADAPRDRGRQELAKSAGRGPAFGSRDLQPADAPRTCLLGLPRAGSASGSAWPRC